MTKPWEGRSVWCSGDTAGGDKGWIEARETGERVQLVIRKPGDSGRLIEMTRTEAKTFAAHLMNLAGRER